MSFLIDPPLLIASGAAIERLAPDDRTARVATAAVAGTFLVTSIGLYADAPWTRWLWRACRARSGRDWMLNSGVTDFEYEHPGAGVHLLAAGLFSLYPWFLHLGRRLARQ